jgi:hypothetical protein
MCEQDFIVAKQLENHVGAMWYFVYDYHASLLV